VTYRELVVAIADLKVSSHPEERLATFALGSCLGISVYDPIARVGGLLHAMLPDDRINPERARSNPAAFVTTGVPLLFRECYRLGAVKRRMVVRVAGGATFGTHDSAAVGRRNVAVLRELLRQNQVGITESNVGGSISRSMVLSIDTGLLELVTDREGADR